MRPSLEEEKRLSAPCIKGTAFGSVLQDVRALIEEGRLDRARVEARVRPEHIEFLDEKVAPASWYPIACYEALLEQLCDLEAEGDVEGYLFRRGAIAAERLHATGIYPQLDASGEKLGLRVFPLVVSIAGSIYNFMRWSVDLDVPGCDFRILVEDAEAYPEVARMAAAGFLHRTTERVIGHCARVWSVRPTPDTVIFRGRILES